MSKAQRSLRRQERGSVSSRLVFSSVNSKQIISAQAPAALVRVQEVLLADARARRPPSRAAGRKRMCIRSLCVRSLGDGEYPDNTALRHILLPSNQLTHQLLLEGGIYAVAGLHGDILDTIDLIGRRRRDDAGIGLKAPKLLAASRVVGAELTVIGPPREDEAAAGGKH